MQPPLDQSLSIYDYRARSSVRIGLFLWPPDLLSKELGKYAQPLLVCNDKDSLFPFGIHGSATYIEYRSRQFAIITRHQIKNNPSKTLGFLNNDRASHSLGGKFYFSEKFGKSSEDYADELVFVDMVAHISRNGIKRASFFKLVCDDRLYRGEQVVFGAGYGFPHDRQAFDVDETGELSFGIKHVSTITREILVRYAGRGLDDTTCIWRPETAFPFPLKGMSGGPMFAITNSSSGFTAKFAGVITMAGSGQIHIVKVESIVRYLDTIIDG